MSTAMEKREMEIGKHSRITLGVACAILLSVVGMTITGIGMYDGVCAKIESLQKSQLTRTDNLTWILEFKNDNPQLRVPIPVWTAPDPQTHHAFAQSTNQPMAAIMRRQ